MSFLRHALIGLGWAWAAVFLLVAAVALACAIRDTTRRHQ
jgi:hypothetical protein